MTLFIAIIATVNIALGYALAIYLGHGQLPGCRSEASLPSKNPKETPRSFSVDAEEYSTQPPEEEDQVLSHIESLRTQLASSQKNATNTQSVDQTDSSESSSAEQPVG